MFYLFNQNITLTLYLMYNIVNIYHYMSVIRYYILIIHLDINLTRIDLHNLILNKNLIYPFL